MVTIAGTAVAGAFNAFAFAGAGYLFQKLNKSGYDAEMERHDRAEEDLAKAKELFYENEVRQNDKIQQQRQRIADANLDIGQTNKALQLFKQVTDNEISEPKLSNFYKPSVEMEEYKLLVGGLMGVGVVYAIYKVIT